MGHIGVHQIDRFVFFLQADDLLHMGNVAADQHFAFTILEDNILLRQQNLLGSSIALFA